VALTRRRAGLALAGLLCASAPVLAQTAKVAPRVYKNDPVSLRAEAYEAAQWAITTEAAGALQKVAAQESTGNTRIGKLESEREDLIHQRDAADKRYIDLLGADASGPNGAEQIKARDEAAKTRDALQTRISAIEGEIETIDPAYYELTRPSALLVADTQKLLNADEALLLLMVGDDATYVWAVSRDRIEWARSETLKEADLKTRVDKLRTQIETDLGTQFTRGEVISTDVETGPTATFDRAIAYELYAELVKPVESVLQGKKVVMTVGSGPLNSLPLSLLVTDPPAADSVGNVDGLQKTHWLIDRYALATLPAVSSLRALRCLIPPAPRRHPGCGTAQGTVARGEANQRKVELVGFGSPILAPVVEEPADAPADGKQRGARTRAPTAYAEAFDTGDLADTDFLRSMPSLPGTKRELEAIGAQFASGKALIRTGADATETKVKGSLELKQARFVIFSTHGLLASETRIKGEPGLVFTPPEEADKTALDDGLLTASEATKLGMSADFVVLSACNTAASDGTQGGDGLSGLAKSFFVGGARSLMVSHWQVNDAATAELIKTTFAEAQKSDVADRAIALQTAIEHVRKTDAWSAPSFWAPFVLVGTGR